MLDHVAVSLAVGLQVHGNADKLDAVDMAFQCLHNYIVLKVVRMK